MKYLSMGCRFFDLDGKIFGKASIELVIPKFRGTKRINTLPAFPLKYHPDKKQAKSDLVECGRKFVRLIDTHHCHCQGEAFLIHKRDPVKFSVDSRVMMAFSETPLLPKQKRRRVEQSQGLINTESLRISVVESLDVLYQAEENHHRMTMTIVDKIETQAGFCTAGALRFPDSLRSLKTWTIELTLWLAI